MIGIQSMHMNKQDDSAWLMYGMQVATHLESLETKIMQGISYVFHGEPASKQDKWQGAQQKVKELTKAAGKDEVKEQLSKIVTSFIEASEEEVCPFAALKWLPTLA